MSGWIGEDIDGYIAEEILGSNQGDTLKVTKNGSIFVLRIVPNSDDNAKTRLKREIEILKYLRGIKNIVQYVDDGESDDWRYVVTEYKSGGTFREFLEKLEKDGEPIGIEKLLDDFFLLAIALDQAHSKGVIHRDLKPENIVFDSDGVPFITDFGIGYTQGQTIITLKSQIIGTPAYLAPDEEETSQSDIYSLATMVYEVIEGMRPFEGSPQRIINMRAKNPPPRPMRIQERVNPRFVDVILEALEIEPEKRPKRVGDFVSRLKEEYKHGTEKIEQEEEERQERTRGEERKRRVVWLVRGVISVIFALFLALLSANEPVLQFLGFLPSNSPTETLMLILTPSNTPSETPSPTEISQPTLTPTDTDTPSNTPFNTSTFTPSTTPTSAPTVDTSATVAIQQTEASNATATRQALEASGTAQMQSILDADATNESNTQEALQARQTTSAQETQDIRASKTAQVRNITQTAAAWTDTPTQTQQSSSTPEQTSNVGQIVFNNGSSIYTINTDGTNLRQLTNNGSTNYAPSWSPDGNQIAFYSHRSGNAEIYIIDADGDNLQQLTDTSVNGFTSSHPSWSPDGSQIAFTGVLNYSTRSFNEEIYVMDIDGSNILRVTNRANGDFSPAWSPLGDLIAFTGTPIFPNQYLHVVNPDGRNERKMTPFVGYQISWSPDGSLITFGAFSLSGVGGIYALDIEQNTIMLLIDDIINPFPTWSPDGCFLAYTQDESIYVWDILANSTQRIASGTSPDWRPQSNSMNDSCMPQVRSRFTVEYNCILSATGEVNLRGGPGTTYTYEGTLAGGQEMYVSGHADGTDGYRWWRLQNYVWVRSDLVNIQGDCENTPTVDL